MTEKELKKLNRSELLELLLEQCRRNEQLEQELEETKKQLESKQLTISECGSLAEASLALTGIFNEAQKAADLYLENIREKAQTSDTRIISQQKPDAIHKEKPELNQKVKNLFI